MSDLHKNSAILIVLSYLDKIEQIHCQQINKRFYEKLIPMMFFKFKVTVKHEILRCKSGQTEYVLYNCDDAEVDEDYNGKSKYFKYSILSEFSNPGFY